MVTSSPYIGVSDHMGEVGALNNNVTSSSVTQNSAVNTTLLLTHYVTLLSSAMGNISTLLSPTLEKSLKTKIHIVATDV